MGCQASSLGVARPDLCSDKPESEDNSPRRRRSYAGGPIGTTKGVISPTEDAKRRRLSVTVTTKAASDVTSSESARLGGGGGGGAHYEPTVVVPDVTTQRGGQRDRRASVGSDGKPVDGNQPSIRTGVGHGFAYCEMSRPGNDPLKQPKENQDAAVLATRLGGRADCAMAMVCDGHGPQGGQAARWVASHFHAAVDAEASGSLLGSTSSVLTRACVDTNGELSMSAVDVYVSGCTGCAVLLLPQAPEGQRLVCANVGDSRAVLGRARPVHPPATAAPARGASRLIAVDLSRDHKPDLPDERARIVACGGRVEEWGVARVWLRDEDVPGLAMSRSFGDTLAESVGAFAEPEITQTIVGAADRLVIVASDGVWEFISSQEALDIVTAHIPPAMLRLGDSPRSHSPAGRAKTPSQSQQTAKILDAMVAGTAALVAEAVARWNREEEVVDDITAQVLLLGAG